MIKYLYQIIEKFSEDLRGTKASPVGDHLFTVPDEIDRKMLPKEQQDSSIAPQPNSCSCARELDRI